MKKEFIKIKTSEYGSNSIPVRLALTFQSKNAYLCSEYSLLLTPNILHFTYAPLTSEVTLSSDDKTVCDWDIEYRQDGEYTIASVVVEDGFSVDVDITSPFIYYDDRTDRLEPFYNELEEPNPSWFYRFLSIFN